MPKFYKQLMVSCLLSLLILLPVFNVPQAATAATGLDLLTNSAKNTANNAIKQQTFATWTGKLTQVIISLVGVILAVIIILGGWKWMLAAGDPAKIAAGKKLIIWGIAGLAVVMMAYTITYFILGKYLK